MDFSFQKDILGKCIVKPLRRTSNDFAIAEGEALVRAALSQILLTRRGEIRWRPSFGSSLERFRHRNGSDGLQQEISDAISDTLLRWEPRISMSKCIVNIQGNTVIVRVTWSVVTQNSVQRNVLIGPVTQEIFI
jgi:phage baseplate assembly protein W